MSALPSNLAGTITQEQWDAIPDARAATNTLLPLFGESAMGRPNVRRARCRDRAAKWQSDMNRAATQLMAACPDDAGAIAAAVEREIVAGPDFTRCRRGSDFRAPPKVNTDRNFVARLMFMARMIERKSWARKDKWKHGGLLGRSALGLLEIMLYVVNKRAGYLSPSYDTLARLACMSRRAVVTAMGVLETMGFVTVHRRIKWVRTPFGVKVVQDTNAYEYHLPKGLGALAWPLFRPASECSNFPARETIDSKKAATDEEVQNRSHSPPRSPPSAALESAA
jgi:hypothetical protein